ncbi:MAG: copper chaperone [Flavobacteriales bacterium]|nr:copper chaperone [Flavobacteriales bacterium]
MHALSMMMPLFVVSLVVSSCGNGIEHARTVEVMINGNCGMCEATIETAGAQDGLSKVDWDRTTRHATITFDSTRTSELAVLKRIANVGYDNQGYAAPDEAYSDRPQCCQYERTGMLIHPPVKGGSDYGH